jgi:cyclase
MLKRIIARLDIKGPDLVKGINLEGLRVLGDPLKFAFHYYSEGIDEFVYQDVVASLYDRNSLHSLISDVAKNIFVPLCVGGGVRTLSDIENLLKAGADKVVINTAATLNPNFIYEAAKKFGSSTIAVGIEAIKQRDNRYFAFTCNGRESTNLLVPEWAKEVYERGAGEIVLTSVDCEGTGKGYDLELVNQVADCVAISVVAHGGAGSKEDLLSLLKNTKASGAIISSLLHYNYLADINSSNEAAMRQGNTDFINSRNLPNIFAPVNIAEIKNYLASHGVSVRI